MSAGDEAKESEEYKGEDLDKILQRIQDYHGLWKVVGVELGIEMDALDTIERNYPRDIDCLHTLIAQWPHGDNSSLTYQALVKAFESEHVSDAKAGKHCALGDRITWYYLYYLYPILCSYQ